MSQYEQRVLDLVNSTEDVVKLTQAYTAFIGELLESPLWSESASAGKRIPWRLAEAANHHPSMQGVFALPGLYLFGTGNLTPLYLGMTTTPLRRRLFGRYLRGPYSQCQLAATFEETVKVEGIDGFPQFIRDWYREKYRGSTVRLTGAVAFARNGIDTIWVALIPMLDKARVRPLERQLIPIANEWNITHDQPALINKQDRTHK